MYLILVYEVVLLLREVFVRLILLMVKICILVDSKTDFMSYYFPHEKHSFRFESVILNRKM